MTIICGLDLETNGLDIYTNHIVELAVVIVKANTTRPIYAASYLLYDREKMGDSPIPPEVQLINGISNDVLQKYSSPLDKGLAAAAATLKHFGVEYLVAHNGEGFDRPVLERHHEGFKGYKWIDTKVDVEWPAGCTSHRLGHLAADHGFINAYPHVAIADVLTMLRLLASHDFATVAQRAATPWVTVRARLPYDQRDKARVRRYQWNPTDRSWQKRLKEDQIQKEKDEAGFIVEVVA